MTDDKVSKTQAELIEEVADLIVKAFEATVADKVVTYDFARLMDGAKEVKTSEFARAVADHM